MIYLDYNATSPLRPSVRAAMEALGGAPLNPASVHGAGRHAKKLLEDARATIATALSAFPNEVLFTGSGSEANNMVLRSFAQERRLLVSAVEHASVEKTAGLLGGSVLPVDADGIVKLDLLEQQLTHLAQPALVSVMLANNETGVIQPLAEIARIAHTYGALVHCDAVQALGKIPLDWGLLGVDMLTVCAHKAGGPVGAGALLIRNDLPIRPLITGGGQELSRRAGTENIPAIVGFATLVEEVAHCPDAGKWLQWRTWLEAQLRAAAPDAQLFGSNAARLPNTLQISMQGVDSATQIMNFDLAGFAVSSGSACSSGRVAPSSVLLAMGISPEIASTAIRISWGWATTQAEIEAFAAAWKATYLRLVKKAA
jgi:cysteine desulfurase